MQTTQTQAQAAPTPQQAAEFLREFVKKMKPLEARTKATHAEFIASIFDEEWAEWNAYYAKKFQCAKRYGGIPEWILGIDTPGLKMLVVKLFGELPDPTPPLSEETLNYCRNNGISDPAEMQDIERTITPLAFSHHDWRVVMMSKFCLYTLNHSGEKTVNGKPLYCTDWKWSKWFLSIPQAEQEDFCEKTLFSYK